MKKIIALLLLVALSGCTSLQGQKSGIECSAAINSPPVSWEQVRNEAPAGMLEAAYSSGAFKCIDHDIPTANDFVCQGCSWTCARESPYFWRLTNLDGNGADVHIWSVPCQGTVLEYRKWDEGYQQGVKVPL